MIATPIRPDEDSSLDLPAEELEEPAGSLALAPFADELPSSLDDAGTDWSNGTFSTAAERCIARFAAAEADVASPELAGLGRVSGSRYPRLGGVLHGRLSAGSVAADALTVGVEQTLRAGYQVALATQQVADVPVRHVAADELWAAFVPASYRIPRSVAVTAWEVCRFDEYWVSLLDELGLHGDARRLGLGRVSPLSRSIRGLSTVGVALAVSERGGRRERYAVDRQPRRERYRPSRGMPPAPRLRAVDGADSGG